MLHLKPCLFVDGMAITKKPTKRVLSIPSGWCGRSLKKTRIPGHIFGSRFWPAPQGLSSEVRKGGGSGRQETCTGEGGWGRTHNRVAAWDRTKVLASAESKESWVCGWVAGRPRDLHQAASAEEPPVPMRFRRCRATKSTMPRVTIFTKTVLRGEAEFYMCIYRHKYIIYI